MSLQSVNAAMNTLKNIEQQVYQFVYQAYKHDKPVITVQNIDQRLRLKRCNKHLKLDWHSQSKAGRNLIKVACTGKNAWKIYVPVKLQVYKMVYLAKSDIQKGELLTKVNTYKKRMDIGKLYRGYIEDLSQYKQRKLKRHIRKHEVLQNSLFEINYAIKRGQQIVLETGNDIIAVKVNGTALDNGQKGDLIKVRNNSSTKIVEAVIQSEGKAVVVY